MPTALPILQPVPIFKNKDYREVLVREMEGGKIPISLGKTCPVKCGFCYEIDARLRPSGKGGLAFTQIDAFEDYLLGKRQSLDSIASVDLDTVRARAAEPLAASDAERWRPQTVVAAGRLADAKNYPLLIEAMALGCPVVTSNVSCMPEIAGDAGLLVDPSNPTAIADAIVELNIHFRGARSVSSRKRKKSPG